MAEPLLACNNLGRRYGAHWALEGISAGFYSGEITALEGPNGSGKSTFFLTLAGILKPHRGTVHFHSGARAHLVAHHPMAYTGLSIIHNLRLAAVIEKSAGEEIDRALGYWNISALRAKTLQTLSRGQMQRFLLARAMLARPAVLLLDEPFTGLDATGEKLLRDFILAQADDGAAVIFSDHDPKRAQSLARRSIRMTAGRVAG